MILFLLLAFFVSPAFAESITFPKSELSRTEMAIHLLNRAAFGPLFGEVENLEKEKQLELWLEQQLSPETIPPKKELHLLLQRLKSIHLNQREVLSRYYDETDPPSRHLAAERLSPQLIAHELSLKKFILARESKAQLFEVMVDFWFNHFNVNGQMMLPKYYISSFENDAIRKNIFGTFENLLIAASKHPAMLSYLNNTANKKKVENSEQIGINENFARELLELHTVGREAYTQVDVNQVAIALTGWTIKEPRVIGEFIFEKENHAAKDVTVLGKTFLGKDAVKQGESLIKFLANHPATAKRISEKLCFRFVREPAPKECIEELSKTFLDTGGDLRAVYKSLFLSSSFWSKQSYRAKFKRPFDFLISAIRSVRAAIIPEVGVFDPYSLPKASQLLGENPFRHPSPTGLPDSIGAWYSAGGLLQRFQSSNLLTSEKLEHSIHIRFENIFVDQQINVGKVSSKIVPLTLNDKTIETIQRQIDRSSKSLNDKQRETLALIFSSLEFQWR